MKITDLRLRTVHAAGYRPYTNALATKLALSDGWKTTVLEVMTDEGITGVVASSGVKGQIRDIVEQHLAPIVIGQDPMNYERLSRAMSGETGPKWRVPAAKGENVRAASFVDTAIWDIIGKKLQTPVYRLLGGFRDEVPAYASGGHYISLDDHSAEMEYIGGEMQRYVDMGFKAVKMRVGRDKAQDLERAQLARQVIGPSAKLMMDFNMSGTRRGGVSETIKFMRALEAVDPFWFEDPVILDDVAGMKQISDAVDTAIATGEMEQTSRGFRDLLVARAVDILLPDATQMCGGITEWRKIATMADAFRIPVGAHIGEAAHLHCIASAPNGLLVEVFTPHDDGYRAHLIDPPRYPNEAGNLTVPQAPGLGIELNETYISENLVD